MPCTTSERVGLNIKGTPSLLRCDLYLVGAIDARDASEQRELVGKRANAVSNDVTIVKVVLLLVSLCAAAADS